MTAEIVSLKGVKPQRHKKIDSEERTAQDIRRLYAKLCEAIDRAQIQWHLKVHLSLDASDTYGGGRVRAREITVTKKL